MLTSQAFIEGDVLSVVRVDFEINFLFFLQTAKTFVYFVKDKFGSLILILLVRPKIKI
jgi:hypothetical protein